MVSSLLSGGADPNAATLSHETPLHVAAWFQSEENFDPLLNGGAEIRCNSGGNSPLHLAAEKNCHVFAQTLLEFREGVNLKNKAGQTALHVAARHGHPDMVRVLLKFKANPNSRGQNILFSFTMAKQTSLT